MGPITDATVLLVNDGYKCGTDQWAFFPDGKTLDIQTIMLHEFGHILGLSHPDDQCGESVSSVMINGTMGARFLTRYDIEAVRSLYGYKIYVVDGKQSMDARSWVDMTPWRGMVSMTRMGSVTLGGSELGMVTVDFTQRVRFRKTDNLSWSDSVVIDSGPRGLTWQPASIATNGEDRLAAVWLSGETTAPAVIGVVGGNNRQIRWATSSNGGETWSPRDLTDRIGFEAHTTGNGVSIAYDARSDSWVFAWVTGDGRIAVSTVELGNSVSKYQWASTGKLSLDAPGIACDPDGPDANCLMVWAATGVDEPDNRLHYAHFSVNDWTGWLDFEDEHAYPWNLFQTPALTHRSYGSRPWVVAFRLDYNVVYTYEKGPNKWDTWRYGSWIGLDGVTSTPTIGTLSMAKGEEVNILYGTPWY